MAGGTRDIIRAEARSGNMIVFIAMRSGVALAHGQNGSRLFATPAPELELDKIGQFWRANPGHFSRVPKLL
jgi:hypothetical protein